MTLTDDRCTTGSAEEDPEIPTSVCTVSNACFARNQPQAKPGPSSVHTWIKCCAKYLNNRSNTSLKNMAKKQKFKNRIPPNRAILIILKY
jgi:hypothetical protein